MKKLIAIFTLTLSLLLCLTACGSKMPYDLSGTASVELHAYDSDSTEPFAKIVVDGEDAATIVEMFSSLKLKKLDYVKPASKATNSGSRMRMENKLQKSHCLTAPLRGWMLVQRPIRM